MTELPAYNQLIQDAEKFLEGNLPPEQMEATLQVAEETVDALYSQFFDGLRFQEDHPVLDEVLDPIFSAFERLAAGREPLREALSAGQVEEARAWLDDGSDALHELHGQFARLREVLGEREPVSRVPAVDELARVVDAFGRGALPEEALLERIVQFAEYHLALAEMLASLEPSESEETLFDRDELQGGLEQQARGVTLLEEAIAAQDIELLEQGIQSVLDGTARLVYLQERLEGVTEEKVRLCVRCSAPNPVTARYCSACMAQLPEMGLQGGPSFVVSDLNPDAGALPENLQVLNAQVEAMLAGNGDREELSRVLQWLQGEVARSRQLFAEQEDPPPETPAEQLEALDSARDAMVSGMDEFEEGLAILESFLGRPDPGRLEHGMELVRAGGLRMLEVEAIFARLRG